MKKYILPLVIFGALAGDCATAFAETRTVLASWYGGTAFEGRLTADGSIFRSADPTIAAHPTLPFDTKLLVTNPENGKTIIVFVRDRGPFVAGRSLDLSRAAAVLLGFLHDGVAELKIRVLN